MAISDLHHDARFALAYRTREPGPEAPRALLVLLHGVGGSETQLSALADAAPADTLVVLARAPHVLGPGQYAWFPVQFTPAGPRIDAVAAEASRQRLVHFIGQLQVAHQIDPMRTVVAGFSQGGILSASVGLSAPERVAGFGLLAGRILPELEPHIAPREALHSLRAFVAHGVHDDKLPVDWAHRAAAWLDALGVTRDAREYDAGHGLTPQMQADFLAWQAATVAGELPDID